MKDLSFGCYAMRRHGHIHGKGGGRDVASVVDDLFASLENHENAFPSLSVKASGAVCLD